MSASNDKSKDKTVIISMVSGLFAGAFAKLITHPLDTIKAKIQVDPNQINMRSTISKTFKSEGIKGFYKGLPISVLGSLPASVLYFGSYEYAKKHLLLFKNFSESEFLMYFISGMFAELVSCILYVPIDVIKERRQVQFNLKTFGYKNDLDAFFTILKQEKIFGLYKAYGATVLSFGPMTAFYFTFYEYFKGYCVRNDAKTYLKRVKNEEIKDLKLIKLDISFGQSLACSALAGALASIITTPLDLVKLRMQVQRASNSYDKNSANYKNIFQGLGFVYRNEGVSGLYRGATARAIYHTPTGAISMSMLELLKPYVKKAFNPEV